MKQRMQRQREVPAARRARAALPVQSRVLVLREDPVPEGDPQEADAGRSRRSTAIEESGAPMVSIAGGEPLVHPEVHVMAERADQAQEVRLPLLERDPDEEEAGSLRAVAVLRVGRPPRRHARAARRSSSSARGSSTRRSRRSQLAKERGFRVNTNTTFLTTDTPKTVRDVLDFLNDELKVDHMMISPAYAYEKAPDQEHFPGVTASRKLFSAAFADGRRKKLAAEPHAALPRLPRGQGRLPVHAVGHPVATRSSAGSGRAT